ncbi:MAG TPA: hypothetical protein VJ912_03795 [Candidatus Nanoarchaeia archaeon]|nr:hypothetical protein [Candidatus Nanoarchaeia archaeon]
MYNKSRLKKNKRGQMMGGRLGVILMLFILIVVGVVFVTAIADQESKMTSKNSVTNETDNLTSNGCFTAGGEVNESNPDCNITVSNWYGSDDWKSSEPQCYLSGVTVTNSTDVELTEDTDYVLHEDEGVIQMLNTSDTEKATMGEEVLTDYEYCPFGYNVDSGSRSIANLITVFFVLALFAAVAFNPAIREWLEGNVLGR